jgi:hypothetical protein
VAKALTPVTFVRHQIERKLVEHGFTPDQACSLAAGVSDQEIVARCEPLKKKALGGGGVLKWIATHAGDIAKVVQEIVDLLALKDAAPPPDQPSK